MLFDPAQGVAPTPSVFDPLSFGEHAQPVGQGGRQAAWFVSAGFGDAVLRHYRRGGLIAKLSRDAYIWRGEQATRAFAEFRVMQRLSGLGLRVPAPLAAGYWRSALTYRAALLTRRIPHARPLALTLDEALIEPVAQTIAAMHRAGAWHADLNAYNIMLDADDQVWLIDFDRATLGQLTDSSRRANVARLQRSLIKVAGTRGEQFGQMLAKAYEHAWQRATIQP
ncbi:MAG: 3-deoxy-D-manno-octulosonic acid kinase [Burkholderiaceae bacterium]